MPPLDQHLLRDLNALDVPREEQEEILGQFYQMLNIRVGIALSETMTDQQMENFEIARTNGGEDAAFQWLNDNVSDYPVIFNREDKQLRAEIRQNMQDLT